LIAEFDHYPHQGGGMPPFTDHELTSTEPDRLVIHPRLFRGVNLLLQALPILVWDFLRTRMSFHAILAVWDSLDFLLDGVEIDRGHNRVTVIRHLKGRHSRTLSDFAQLLIDRIDEGHYTLSLAGPSGAFPLLPFRTYSDTRHTAERIATYVGFDIRDEALGSRILIRRPRAGESGDWDEQSAEHALPAGANETAALLVRRSENHADVLRIDHDEDPGKSAMIAVALVLLSAATVVAAWLFQALIPVSAVVAAVGVAEAILWILYRRRGVIFIRDADWFIAWRFFKTSRFTQLVPLSQYSEVVLHAEDASATTKTSILMPTAARARSLTRSVSTVKKNRWKFDWRPTSRKPGSLPQAWPTLSPWNFAISPNDQLRVGPPNRPSCVRFRRCSSTSSFGDSIRRLL
jgi:hypothetical protein